MRHLVLRDGGEREVLFQMRHPPGPLAVTVPDDQLVVGQREQQLEPRIVRRFAHDDPDPGGRGRSMRSPRVAISAATRFSFAPTPAYAS